MMVRATRRVCTSSYMTHTWYGNTGCGHARARGGRVHVFWVRNTLYVLGNQVAVILQGKGGDGLGWARSWKFQTLDAKVGVFEVVEVLNY